MNFTKDELYQNFKKYILGKRKIEIAGFVFNTAYNYRDSGSTPFYIKKGIPILELKQEEKLKENLYNYINAYFESSRKFTHPELYCSEFGNDKDKLMFALSNLFVNAGFEDFEQMNQYIECRLDFINSNLYETYQNWCNAGSFEGVEGSTILYRVAQNNYAYETPDRLEVKVIKTYPDGTTQEFFLPSASFGISQHTAYVYTLQNLKQHEDENENTKLVKELKRARFKINENVDSQDQDVEPFSVVTASVLTGFLQSQQVEKVKVINFLPIRYDAKHESYMKKTDGNPAYRKDLLEKQQHIQENLTDKFLKVFYRVSEQTGALTPWSDMEPSCTIFENTATPTTVQTPSPFLISLVQNTAAPTLEK